MPEREEREPYDARSRAAERAAAAARIQQQQTWVDLQLRRAMERGDFDDLPGAGRPIGDLGSHHDPDWWVKQLIRREQVTGVLPPALQLRKDDAELDARLDRLAGEREVRAELEDFNARVMRARYTPVDGPPLVTQPRDVAVEVERWRERRRARHTGPRAPTPAPEPPREPRRTRLWSWSRSRRRG